MKKLILALIFLSTNAYAAIDNPLNFTEEDGSPDTYPYKVKFSNGTVTDNGDGTISITTGSSTPAGTDRDIQFNDGGSFGGDRTIQWYKGANTLVISRDSGQTSQPAIIISGDSNNRLANISHDGAAFFSGVNVNGIISSDEASAADNTFTGPGTTSASWKNNGSVISLRHNYFQSQAIDRWFFHVTPNSAVSSTAVSMNIGYNLGSAFLGLTNMGINFISGSTEVTRISNALAATRWVPVGGSCVLGDGNGDAYVEFSAANGLRIYNLSVATLIAQITGTSGSRFFAPSSSIVPTTIKGAVSQSANMMEFQDSSGNVQLAVDSNYALATTASSTTQQIQARSRTGMGGVGGDFTFEVKRDGTNNFGNGAILKMTDNASSAQLKWMSSSFSQNVMDFELHTSPGKVYSSPSTGGNFYYNPLVNTQRISILEIPTQNMSPGAGTPSPQGLFRIQVCPVSATSANSLVDTASLWIEGAPTQSTNMTMTNRISALIQAGDPAGVPIVISADNIQTANLLEFKTAEGAVLMDIEEDGVILLSRDVTVITNISGEMAFDTNAHATNRGAIQAYDGTANTYVVAVQAADTPSDGQVATWHTGGVISWDTASGGGHKVFMNFPIQSAKLSDDVGTRIEAVKYYWRGLFEDGTNALNKNVMLWQGRMDDNWDSSSLTAKIDYIMISSDSTSTAGAKISWDVAIMAITSGDAASLDTESFDAECIGSQQVPTVMSRDNTMSIPITNSDSLAPGDWFIVKLRRDGSDTITGDAAVISFALTQ